MPRFGPIKRRDLIHYLRRAGFSNSEVDDIKPCDGKRQLSRFRIRIKGILA